LPDASGTLNTSGAPNVVPAGTVSAPSITTDGDTNTGIFFPAADTIAFAEGGVEAMRIDSSGNVLVGTTTAPSSSNIKQVIQTSPGGYIQFAASSGGAAVGTPGSSALAVFTYTGAVGSESYTERMRIDSSGNLLFNSGYGSVATAYGCRAWVNFNGTGTPAIREDGNVSSITDNGTGDYTVNFTTAMPDVNYCVTGAAQWDTFGSGYAQVVVTVARQATGYQTGSVRLQTGTTAVADPEAVNIAIFR
jgi:hypothetical protein